jgi:hypothetical protein
VGYQVFVKDINCDIGFQPERLCHLYGNIFSINPGAYDACQGFKTHGRFCDALLMGKKGCTPCAVPAHLGLASVGIEDPKGEISSRIVTQHDHTIGAYAGLQGTGADCKGLPLKMNRVFYIVHQDEVVSCPCHLGEKDLACVCR